MEDPECYNTDVCQAGYVCFHNSGSAIMGKTNSLFIVLKVHFTVGSSYMELLTRIRT